MAANAGMTSSNLIARPRTWVCGIRKPRTFEVWPLSISDQDALASRIDGTLKEFFSQEGAGSEGGGMASDANFAMFLLKILKENICIILKLVTGLDDAEVGEIAASTTNKQAETLLHVVWEMNYADIAKNLKGLLGKVMAGVAVATD